MTETGPDAGSVISAGRVKLLELQLADNRRWSRKVTRDLHRTLLADVRAAEQRADAAEKRAAQAERRLAAARRRARQARAEVATIKDSSTWKVGRVVVAVPARLMRRGR